MIKIIFSTVLIALSIFIANTQAVIRFVKVVPSTNTITIKNFGDESLDISDYRLCSLIKYTSDLTDGITINSGSLDLAPGMEVEIVAPGGASSSWTNLQNNADLGLYLPSGSFGSSSSMVDFVQWGSSGNGRESVASSKEIWTTGDFISSDEPYIYSGNSASDNGLSFWNAVTNISNNVINNSVNAYPNPAVSSLIIPTDKSGVFTVSVFDLKGASVLSEVVSSANNKVELDIQQIKSGTYVYELISEDKSYTLNGKFIKN